MASRTFAQAREEIFQLLIAKGWTVKRELKVPHATRADGEVRLWFRPQAVWYTEGNRHVLNNGRSTWTDIREISAEDFIKGFVA